MIDFILSDDSRAQHLRETTEFFVYPLTNPSGRVAGYYRSNPENPREDFAGFYDDPDGFTELSALTEAMKRDTGGDIDVSMDFHSWFEGWARENWAWVGYDDFPDPFFTQVANLEPGFVAESLPPLEPGPLIHWARTVLNAEFAITPEIGFHPFRYEDDLKRFGESLAIALNESPLVPCDFNFNGLCDLADLDALLAEEILGSVIYDLDGSLTIDLNDRDIFLRAIDSLPGDFDLSGKTDVEDLNVLALHWQQPVTSFGVGDANGDGFVDSLDLNDVGVYWQATGEDFAMADRQPIPVPEPVRLLVWFAFGVHGRIKGEPPARRNHPI